MSRLTDVIQNRNRTSPFRIHRRIPNH